jgi:cardiolipin synthase
MNLNYISNRSSLDDGQRDSMFCFESESAAAALLEDFVDFWNTYSWDEVSLSDFYVPEEPQVEDSYQAWVINQFNGDKPIASVFGSILYSAKEEVLILPLLPMENADTRKAIADAVDRGVEVEMILPNDPRESVYRGAHYSVAFLMETGMKIYPEPNTKERKNLLHEKTIIVDGEYVLIGSANFNYRSLVLSNEVGIMIHSPEFAQFMTEHYNTIKDGCELITPEQAENWHKITWLIDFLVHFYMG